MKNIILFIGAILSAGMSFAQGIHFEDSLSWQQVIAKAKTEHKYIFVDCFATWCGPCKMMDENIYLQRETGDFFNAHFINVKVQLDKTNHDNDYVKSWYDDSIGFAKNYQVHAFPTFLFFDENGHIVHKFTGAKKRPSDFIAAASNAIDPQKQYYTQLANLKSHLNDTTYLLNALNTSLDVGDKDNTRIIGGYYLTALKDPFTKSHISTICNFTYSTTDPGFDFLLKNKTRINALLGADGSMERKLAGIIYREQIQPKVLDDVLINFKQSKEDIERKYPIGQAGSTAIDDLFFYDLRRLIISHINLEKTGGDPDWNAQDAYLERRFTGYNPQQVLLKVKLWYYERKNNWPKYSETVLLLTNFYGKTIDDYEFNDIAYKVFQHSDDRAILEACRDRMKTAATQSDMMGYVIDTYANLLYKTGDRENAMKWEAKAIKEVERNSAQRGAKALLSEFFSSLNKMKNNEKTW